MSISLSVFKDKMRDLRSSVLLAGSVKCDILVASNSNRFGITL